jgi:hypothetical protein
LKHGKIIFLVFRLRKIIKAGIEASDIELFAARSAFSPISRHKRVSKSAILSDAGQIQQITLISQRPSQYMTVIAAVVRAALSCILLEWICKHLVRGAAEA